MKSGCIAAADTVAAGVQMRLRHGAGVAVMAVLLVGCSGSSPGVTGSSSPAATASRCVEAWSRLSIPGVPSSASGGPAYLGIARVPDGPLAALAAISPTDVWAVGKLTKGNSDPQVTTLTEHWNGTRWAVVPAPDVASSIQPGQPGDLLAGVSAASNRDVWAVGASARAQRTDSGNIVDIDRTLAEHWDGQRWSVIPSADDESTDDILVAVSARSSSDVWAVGTANHTLDWSLGFVTPLVEHWDGARWSVVHAPTPGLDPANSAAVAAVVAGFHGGQPKDYDDASFSAVHAIAPDDVWAVGVINRHTSDSAAPTQTFTEHWNGTRWSVVNAPDVHVSELRHGADDSLNAVTATRGNDVWAVGAASPQGTLTLHWDGSAWTVVPSARSGTFSYLSDVAAISATDVWAVGSAIERWDGRRWSQTATIDGKTFSPLLAVAAVSARDIWMAGRDEFLHYTCR